MGVNLFTAIQNIPQNNIVAIAGYGANNVEREVAYVEWNTNTWFKNYVIEITTNAHAVGMDYILCCFGPTFSTTDSDKYNAVHDSAIRAAWINNYKTIIQILQPDGVTIMNEPPASLSASDLNDFYLSCIDSWRLVKSNLYFIIDAPWVSSGTYYCPFSLNATIVGTRVDQSRPTVTIYYAIHHYYYFLNVQTSDPVLDEYWSGDLGNAKTDLYDYFDHFCGLEAARNLGLNLFFEEFGCHILNPNYDAYMNDCFVYAESYGISVNWVSWYVNNYTNGSWNGTGMIDNWTPTLSDIGEIWANYLPGNLIITPPPPSFTPTMPNDITPLFTEDFERTILSPKWINQTSGDALIEISTAQYHGGTNSCLLYIEDNSGDTLFMYNNTTFSIEGQNIWVSCWVYIANFTHTPDKLTPFSGSIYYSASNHFHFYISDYYNNGTIYGNVQTPDNPPTQVIPLNTWALMEVHWYMDDASGYYEMFIGGVQSSKHSNFTVTSSGIHEQYMTLYTVTEIFAIYIDDYGLYYETPPPSDSNPPTYSSLTYSSTIAGTLTKFTVIGNDNVGLDYAIFTTNNTGTWVPTSSISFTATPQQINVSKVLTTLIGVKVGYKWIITDTSGNINDTGVRYFTTMAPSIPPSTQTPGSPGAMIIDIYPIIGFIFLVGSALVIVTGKRNVYERKIKI